MVSGLIKKIIGSRNDRLLKQYRKTVNEINSLESKFQGLTDDHLKAKTQELKAHLTQGKTLDDILPEAFALVREASKRTLKMRHFDVQMIGGMALHEGKIAEMRTGEGKTLTATLPVFLNALSGKGVHVITVNDYLAKRDADWMSTVYNFLGLTVGVNLSNMSHEEKQQAYGSDITYGTNNEFGFDYLRDNMVHDAAQRVQRGLNFAIVDEVDSILIDEARTPLIISGQADDHTEVYIKMNVIPGYLDRQIGEEKADGTGVEKPGDYVIDEKSQQVFLTESGHEKAENILVQIGLLKEGDSLYAPQNIALMHHLLATLRAHTLFHKDQHYVVQNGEVIIVDEFTGRLMTGRRWSEGLHQAVEAKEGVAIQNENQTMATITFQNYFRMYTKLSGMTGTADTEAYEFQEIYGLETVVIPPNRISKRVDKHDQIYKTSRERYNAVIADIKDCFERGQPTLVGTTSIENSELISAMLTKEKLSHQVLNAKQHAREAEIIAQAGRPKMITIGTERHESRRIDNQLRGRSGRQGDPGSSRFYLSLDDDLLRIFAGDRLRTVMERLKMPDGEPIEANMVSRAIESAQRKVEGRNFDIRKQLLEYDDVANDQRRETYHLRNQVLEAQDVSTLTENLRIDVFNEIVLQYVDEQALPEQWDIAGLERELENEWSVPVSLQQKVNDHDSVEVEDVQNWVQEAVKEAYQTKIASADTTSFTAFERSVFLYSLDTHWREHLAALDYLRQGIHLRGYAQKDPKQEYRREAFELYANLLADIKKDITKTIMSVRIASSEQLNEATNAIQEDLENIGDVQYQHAQADSHNDAPSAQADEAPKMQPIVNTMPKVGRNDPCPCGSGKKYKQCHGAIA